MEDFFSRPEVREVTEWISDGVGALGAIMLIYFSYYSNETIILGLGILCIVASIIFEEGLVIQIFEGLMFAIVMVEYITKLLHRTNIWTLAIIIPLALIFIVNSIEFGALLSKWLQPVRGIKK